MIVNQAGLAIDIADGLMERRRRDLDGLMDVCAYRPFFSVILMERRRREMALKFCSSSELQSYYKTRVPFHI